jgi:hypothetical protein
VNPDPLGQAGGANLYGYAGNNPSTYADPLGLVSRAHYVAGGGAVGAVGGAAVGGGLPGAAILGAYGAVTGGSLYDSADAFGTAYGCYEGGYASVWQVAKSGLSAAVNVVGTALFIGGTVAPKLAPAPVDSPAMTVTVMHKGYLEEGVVVPRAKPFSTTAPGVTVEQLNQAVPGDAPIHQFHIPEDVLQDWQARDWVREYYAEMNGVQLREYRFNQLTHGDLEGYRGE